MTKYKPSRDIPLIARQLQTLDLDEIKKGILKKRNKNIKRSSIKMWLHRNNKVAQKIKEEIIAGQVGNLEVTPSIFINGTFEKLPTVDVWNKHMIREMVVNRKSNLAKFKNICRGTFQGWSVPNWTVQHPDRLTQEDVLLICDYCMTHNREGQEVDNPKDGIDDSNIRLVARNFFRANNLPHQKISGAKSRSFGKYKRLHYPQEKIDNVLHYVYSKNEMAGHTDLFMFKTATRVSATLTAKIENIQELEIDGVKHRFILVYDKARRKKNPEGKEWTKYIPPALWDTMKEAIGDRKFGNVFTIDRDELTKLNKEAITTCIPELLQQFPKYRMWNHFFRHMFAQSMLHLTNFNTMAVAELGGWTEEALIESYGKPPIAMIRQWGLKYIPKI